MTQALRSTILEIYQYREVLYSLLARDLKVKYKRTSLGYFWSLLNPLLQLAVSAAVFSHLVGKGMDNYTHFLFSGLLAWTFFQSSLTMASRSIIEGENFIKKIYLPKLIFPLSKVCLRAIDFLFSLLALSLIGLVAGFSFKVTTVLLVPAILLLFIFTLGLSVVVAVADVYFRDVEYLLGVFLQLLYFATPILYPVTALPDQYQTFLRFNPLYPQIHLFQQLLYFGNWPTAAEWLAATGVAFGMFALGAIVLLTLEEDLVFRL